MSPRSLVLALLLVALLAPALGAQNMTLPEALQVVGRLQKTLGTLSPRVEGWRFKLAAGVPDGGAAKLDDSAWEPVKLRHDFTGDNTNAWYRATLTIPERVAGFPLAPGDVILQADADDLGETWVNGKLVQSFEGELGIATIARNARPGDVLQLAIKVINQRGGAGLKSVSVSYASLQPFWRQLAALLGSLQLVSTAVTKEQRADWLPAALRAVAQVDTKAMDQGDLAAFTASLARAGAELKGIDRELKALGTIYLVGNSHIDLAWEWPWHDTVDVCRRTFTSALNFLDEYPGLVYSQTQAAMYEWMEERYPEIFARIRAQVAAGRWEISGGMWTEPDCNIPSGESLVRQFLLGKRYFQEKFGVDVTQGANLDTFGFNANLPQIYRRSGVDFFVTGKLNWNETTKLPHQLFWWQGPDGSRLLSYLPRIEFEVDNPILFPYQGLKSMREENGLGYVAYVLGVGDHGGGPTRQMLEFAKTAQEMPAYPRVEMGSTQQFIDAVKGAPSLPVWRDELYLEFHRGVFTSMARIKQLNRQAERDLHDAELFCTWAARRGAAYPRQALTRAWKLLAKNQMHDILPGTAFSEVYDDAQADFAELRHLAQDARTQALRELLAGLDTSGQGTPVVVFNPLPWTRADLVLVDLPGPAPEGNLAAVGPDGRRCRTQWVQQNGQRRLAILAEGVPAFGYALFHLRPAPEAPPADLVATPQALESPFFRVELDPATGWISRVFDKRLRRELLAPGQAVSLQAFQDKPRDYDAWNIDADYVDHPLQFAPGAKIEVVETGPVRAVVRVTKQLGKSTIATDITLYHALPRIDLRTHADWQEEHVLLKAAVPAALDPGVATYEIPYASLERTTKPQTPAEKAKFEVPAQQWADLSTPQWGLSLLNDCKYGYDARDNVLRLSLLRSPQSRESPGVFIDKGEHDFTYSLYSHQGDWRTGNTVRAARELNDPLLSLVARSRLVALPPALPVADSLLTVGPDNILVEVVKLAEEGGDWIIRWSETAGQPATARLALPAVPARVVETDLLERELRRLPAAQELALPTGPYEIKTIRVTWK